MKVSEKWLREYYSSPLSLKEILEKFTMGGLEIESVTPAGCQSPDIVVAEVLKTERHPNADRLSVCQVSDGSQQYQIVCGAANVRAGLKVALAKIGAKLSPAFEIKLSKLRGVESQGMLCSAEELGLAEKSEGIIELEAEAPVGQKLVDYLGLDDNIIEFGITPNRGDCLSVYGLARDLSALTESKTASYPAASELQASATNLFTNTISEKAPVYHAVKIDGIDNYRQLPNSIKQRLLRSGLRLINPLVDLVNYVMLELGQPMHAFDFDKIKIPLKIQLSKDNSSFVALDKNTYTLNSSDLVICDQNGIVALAGIIGSEASAVDENTHTILLESAHFVPETIAKSLRCLQLTTDASFRFERGVDPALPAIAVKRLADLILQYLGGKVSAYQTMDESKQVYPGHAISLTKEQVDRTLGINIPDKTITQKLESLQMKFLSETSGHCKVIPPSYRFDIERPEDLIEEIARLYGYDQIKSSNITVPMKMASLPAHVVSDQQLYEHLSARGFMQVINYSFIDEKIAQWFSPQASIKLANPLSADLSVMRTSLIPGLIQTAIYNFKRQQYHIRIYELAVCFNFFEEKISEEEKVAGLLLGEALIKQWGSPSRLVDYFDAKNEVIALLDLAKTGPVTFKPCEAKPYLHPGKSAYIYLDNQIIGYVGELHPAFMQMIDINASIAIFELNTSCLKTTREKQRHEISKFPSVSRDLAFILDRQIQYGEVEASLKKTGGKLLRDIELFDIYQGQQIEQDKKSLAVRLTFQSLDQTLTDDVIDELITKLMRNLENDFAAQLRG